MGEPGAWGNFKGMMRGEVDASMLEAFHRAGSSVYDLADEVEEKRQLLCLAGRSPWQFPMQFQTELLCSWNALVLQSLGDRLLLDDYMSDPATEGLVPSATLEQAERFYGQVGSWLVAARMASASDRYRVRRALPAVLPMWDGGPRPAGHLRVLQSMCDFLLGRLTPVVGWYRDLEATKAAHTSAHRAMQELLAEADARSDYADHLLVAPSDELLHTADTELQRSLSKLFALGQYAATPGLLRDVVAPASRHPQLR